MVSANQSAITEVMYKCQPCKKSFKTIETLDEHKKSKKHKKNEKEYKSKNPESTENSMFTSISQNQSQNSSVLDKNILEELKEDDKPLTVEESGAEKVPRRTALDSMRICLFCNKEFSGVKKCLDHMLIEHSFSILDIDCLVDLKGLLGYMAERIHLGALCLHCNKQFSDGRRCQ